MSKRGREYFKDGTPMLTPFETFMVWGSLVAGIVVFLIKHYRPEWLPFHF